MRATEEWLKAVGKAITHLGDADGALRFEHRSEALLAYGEGEGEGERECEIKGWAEGERQN